MEEVYRWIFDTTHIYPYQVDPIRDLDIINEELRLKVIILSTLTPWL